MKIYQNWNVAPTEMSPKLNCKKKYISQNSDNEIKSEMLPDWNIAKTAMSPKLKCDQNWNVTRSENSSKVECHQN